MKNIILLFFGGRLQYVLASQYQGKVPFSLLSKTFLLPYLIKLFLEDKINLS